MRFALSARRAFAEVQLRLLDSGAMIEYGELNQRTRTLDSVPSGTQRPSFRSLLRPDDMIVLARFEERIKTRLQDALNTASEYGLDVEQMVSYDDYPQLARFAKMRREEPW